MSGHHDDRAIRIHGGDAASGNVLAIETRIPAGMELEAHRHAHGHLSVLAQGTADVTIDGKTQRFFGPCVVTVPANTEHKVVSVSAVVWYCLWADDLAPVDQAAESLRIVESAIAEGADV
jgi:quercetin dioxygenase-like cupin family protein